MIKNGRDKFNTKFSLIKQGIVLSRRKLALYNRQTRGTFCTVSQREKGATHKNITELGVQTLFRASTTLRHYVTHSTVCDGKFAAHIEQTFFEKMHVKFDAG